MMLLEEVLVCGGVSFHLPCTSRVGEGICIRVTGRRSARVASVLPYLLSCWWLEVRPPLGDLDRALFSQALLVLRGHPGVAPWLSHEGLSKFKGGLGHELSSPGAVLHLGSPSREGRWEIEVGQVTLKRPPVGHFLAAGDAGLRDPRKRVWFVLWYGSEDEI